MIYQISIKSIKYIIQMSSNFLQRFKGKTQTISKDGVANILGGASGSDAYVYTHSNGLPVQQKLQSTQTSNMNSSKNKTQQINKKPDSKPKPPKPNDIPKPGRQKIGTNQKQQPPKPPKQQNPFLISNPFYLDEQERQRQEQQRREQLRLQKLQNQKRKQVDIKDPKKGTYASSMNGRRQSVTKKSQKQWVKLGGLGANIGGEEWQEKRKKQQKMQQFASQVKAINTNKVQNTTKTVMVKKQQKKQDPRTKALQYSKKVPKPVVKTYEKQQQPEQTEPMQQINQNQLSELELYQLRHKQLKQMLKNQL